MSSKITLLELDLPQSIDVSNGTVTLPFSITATLAQGVTIDDVLLALDEGAVLKSFKDDGQLVDTFADATPGSGTSMLEFDGAMPPGQHRIGWLYLVTSDGGFTTYTADDLMALGFQPAFTVVNAHAPDAPTIALQGAPDGVFGDDNAVLAGTATPGSTVTVSGYYLVDDRSQFREWKTLGTAQADAAGTWRLVTDSLADGYYGAVRATAASGGSSSGFSSELAFHVATRVPDVPTLHTRLDELGHAGSATPFVSGMTSANASVTIFDGTTLVATTVSDRDGWYGTLTSPLQSGNHRLTAVATDIAGHASAPSDALAVAVVQQAASGIVFDIVSLTNKESVALAQPVLQALLNEVGTNLSTIIGGNQRIALHVEVDPAMDFIAATAPGGDRVFPADGMPVVKSGDLWLSVDFASDIAAHPQGTRAIVDTLTHEMLHILAFNSGISAENEHKYPWDDKYSQQIDFIGNKPWFTGYYASAINGGKVALADNAHVDIENDTMFPTHVGDYSQATYFSEDNPTAPLSGVDLAILKDIGYAIKDAFASADGHTFVAGDGTPGHDHVTGSTGTDTLVVGGKAAGVKVQGTSERASLLDTVHGVTWHLASIERIRFADTTLVLDVEKGQAGGEAYRLYQAAFNREPDAGGLGFWIDALDHGATLEDVAGRFVASRELAALYGDGITDRQFVDQVYENVLHRAPDGTGASFWLDALHAGASRAVVLVGFSESAENVAGVGAAIANGFMADFPA